MEINWDYVLVALAMLLPFALYGGWLLLNRLRRRGQLASLAAGKDEPSFASQAAPVAASQEPEIEAVAQVPDQLPAAAPPSESDVEPDISTDQPPAGEQQEDARASAAQVAADTAVADDASQPPAAQQESGPQDKFPALSANDLPEHFYYVARLSCPAPGFAAAQMREMSADIVKQARLQKHQLLLGWDGGKWQSLRSEMKYRCVVWCIPLCTRTTCIENEEIAAVTRCIRTWMQRTGGQAQLPVVKDVKESLQQVHEFCEPVDAIFAVRLVAMAEDNAKVHSCAQILEIAYAHGLENVEGRIERRLNSETLYSMRAANGDELGSKSPDRKLASIVLELDVPRVTRPRESCEEMFEFAGKLARVLGYRMLDEKGQQIEKQDEQECLLWIEDVVLALREQGIKPGGRLARALFS
ncbi:MAG: hypothetical protein OXC81_03490 [Betaproteobacteria bacterium]|nr:hypothetical protein [Betaproteobacteria bacterium]